MSAASTDDLNTSQLDVSIHGLRDVTEVLHNPSYETLFAHETNPNLSGYERGVLTELDAINVDTGIFTGRSPKDKYIVKEASTQDDVWWSSQGKNDNHPLTQATWDDLKAQVLSQLSGKRLYVIDGFCGASTASSLKVRIITEVAWQAHFVKNMFIRPTPEQLADFEPDFVVLNGSKCTNIHWKQQQLNSENFVAFHLQEKMQLIGGTWYGG